MLESDYLKRLKKWSSVKLVDIRERAGDLKRSRFRDPALKRMMEDCEPVVVLDQAGRDLNSEDLARKMVSYLQSGTHTLNFVVGGPAGLEEAFKRRADFLLKLSSLTLPHQLARLVLLEALYRSFDILHARRYHR